MSRKSNLNFFSSAVRGVCPVSVYHQRPGVPAQFLPWSLHQKKGPFSNQKLSNSVVVVSFCVGRQQEKRERHLIAQAQLLRDKRCVWIATKCLVELIAVGSVCETREINQHNVTKNHYLLTNSGPRVPDPLEAWPTKTNFTTLSKYILTNKILLIIWNKLASFIHDKVVCTGEKLA